MGGHGGVMAAFRHRYDAVAAAEWAAAAAAGDMMAAIARALTGTGDAYLATEHAVFPQGAGSPPRLPRAGEPAPARVAAPPPSAGAVGPDVPDDAAGFYPGGDPGLIRVAAGAWRELSDALQAAGVRGDAAFRGLLAHNSGATFSAMARFWERQFVACAPASGSPPLITAAALGASTLAQCCAQLADAIDRTRASTRDAFADAAAEMEPFKLLAELLNGFTRGGTEIVWGAGFLAFVEKNLLDSRAAYYYDLDSVADRLSPDLERALTVAAAAPQPDSGPAPDPARVGVQLPDVAEIAAAGLTGTAWDGVAGEHPTPDSVHLVPQRIKDILDGERDGKRGGHRSGTGNAGKTEFPPTWSDARILAAVLSVARTPQVFVSATNGMWLVRGSVDSVVIEVWVRRDGWIGTGYPIRGPGVITNPP